MLDSKEVVMMRLEKKIDEVSSNWLKLSDIQQLIDDIFEYNRDGWLDEENLIKKSSSWQTHRESFDRHYKYKNFKTSDGEEKLTGEGKGRKYHVEYVKNVIDFRFKQLQNHYENNSIEFRNPISNEISKISKRENELREKHAGNYQNIQNELFQAVAIKFAKKNMDLEKVEKDIHSMIVHQEKTDNKILARFNEANYHK